MKSPIILVASFFVCTMKLNAQMNYSLTPATNTYTSISAGSSPFLIGNGFDLLADEGYANNIPIGFSFNYNGGTNYTQVAVSTNGFISFNSLSDSYLTNNLTSGATGERPIVAPLWDDINLQTTNNLKYKTTGTAPNRIFTVEWLNARWGFGAATACISFEVKLYETSNWIEFNYREETGTPLAPTASIGLTASSMGTNNFLSLLGTSSIPGASVSTEMNTISNKPTSNQSYVFKPGVLPVLFASFSVSKNNGSHSINWQTLSEINNAGFEIQRSIDGINFNKILLIDSKASNGNSSSTLNYMANDTKPFDGMNYYRLKQVDKDGRFNYSSIASIKNTNNETWASMSIYPNPVNEKLALLINSKQSNTIYIGVFDALGTRILAKKYSIAAGSTQLYLDMSSLPFGVYSIKISGNNNALPLIKTFVK